MFTKLLILFLVRKRLRLRRYEPFKFTNQKSEKDFYWFAETELMKYNSLTKTNVKSGVSLNWLLDDQCEIKSCYAKRYQKQEGTNE